MIQIASASEEAVVGGAGVGVSVGVGVNVGLGVRVGVGLGVSVGVGVKVGVEVGGRVAVGMDGARNAGTHAFSAIETVRKMKAILRMGPSSGFKGADSFHSNYTTLDLLSYFLLEMNFMRPKGKSGFQFSGLSL